MADILAEKYSSVFSTPLYHPQNINDKETNLHLHIKDIEFNDIIEAINDLNSNSAAELDWLPAILLKECKDELASPIFHICKQALTKAVCSIF